VSITKHHSIKVEVISFNTETKDSGSTYYYAEKTIITFTPIVLTYRYMFPVNDKFAAFAGFSVGFTDAKYEIIDTPVYNYSTYYAA